MSRSPRMLLRQLLRLLADRLPEFHRLVPPRIPPPPTPLTCILCFRAYQTLPPFSWVCHLWIH